MAWGRSSQPSPPPASRLWSLLPLLIALAIVGAIAWVVYQIYLTLLRAQAETMQKMESSNVALSRDGVRVGVRNVGHEKYVDQTQSWVVKAWNLRSEETGKKKKGKGKVKK
ncbi:hypothetical protein VTJ83DRAFT_2988 [Remersonia thermophila]|uniref:Uncharacterized protein n=1 Tax=Remersonia thermophila TaxID=72144 RepID=A0ABR4DEZ1_9PEZI